MGRACNQDHWRRTFCRNYTLNLIDMDLKGVNGIKKINLRKGIFAVCGLNGAGKSTVLSFLKDIIGIELNKQDEYKIKGESAEANFKVNGNDFNCFNADGNRLKDKFSEFSATYLDYNSSTSTLKFLEQDNLDELLAQFEEEVYDEKLLRDLSSIVRKQYDFCSATVIEEEEVKIPYFKVVSDDVSYNSLSMGLGEHNIMYLFWTIEKMPKNSLVMLEEPETFLSIHSQASFMDYLAKKADENGIVFIISTHSPYILRQIPKENICILSRYRQSVAATIPTDENKALRVLGLQLPTKGLFIVEDEVGELFLKELLARYEDHILNDYIIENVHGDGEIVTRLKYKTSPKSKYQMIGVFDGDMLGKLDSVLPEFKSRYLFLPVSRAAEVEFQECIASNLEDFSESISKRVDEVVEILSQISGKDHHDCFIDLCNYLHMDKPIVFNKIFDIWCRDAGNQEKIAAFIEEVKSMA